MGGNAIIKNNTIYGCPNPEDVHEFFNEELDWGMMGLDINDTKNVHISKNVIRNCNPAMFLGDFPDNEELGHINVVNNELYFNTVNFLYYHCTEDDITWEKNILN